MNILEKRWKRENNRPVVTVRLEATNKVQVAGMTSKKQQDSNYKII